MGMFDWVDFECKCPSCGQVTGGFQTKDLGCDLSNVKPWECREFYAMCEHCNQWIHYSLSENDNPVLREPPPEPLDWLSKYTQSLAFQS